MSDRHERSTPSFRDRANYEILFSCGSSTRARVATVSGGGGGGVDTLSLGVKLSSRDFAAVITVIT